MAKKRFMEAASTGKWYTSEGWPPKSPLDTKHSVDTSVKDPPPNFVKKFDSKGHEFSKQDNKYAHRNCGEFLGKSEGLTLRSLSPTLHKSDDIISWGNSSSRDCSVSRTQMTYTAPGAQQGAAKRRFQKEYPPPTAPYKLSTTTTSWNPDPEYQTLYKVLAVTQHRHNQPNTWKYSTHPEYKLSQLKPQPDPLKST